MKVIIIGGVAGGATAAARLRRLNEQAKIILLEKGEFISFANCGLPYYIGGEITEKSKLILQSPKSFRNRFNVDVRLQHEAIGIDRSAKTVTIKTYPAGETYSESYDKLILSPGAVPILPEIDGIAAERIFTLRTIRDTYKIKEFIDSKKPKKAVIAGGGYIGLETAENLYRLGMDVTIIQRSNQVLAPFDYDAACDVHRHIESKGVHLYLNSDITEKTRQQPYAGSLRNADLVIAAIGVVPDSGLARSAGLALNENGCIVVNSRMLTSDENIYAVGDAAEVTDFVTGQKAFIPLAGPANKQGRIAADNICSIASKYCGTQGSSILRVFDMTAAATGINEKTAAKMGFRYDKCFLCQPGHAGYYPDAALMAMKVIFESGSGRILGAQITGYDGVDKRCDVLATAIRAGMTAYDLTKLELCYAPPYSSAKDPVNMAGFAIENILTGKVKQFHWHNVATLPRGGSIILLDTRTEKEYANGHIGGFINIPLDSLRSRLDELDKNKTVYVTCQVGQRGYSASRILSQNGFDVYNLSGGYRLYHSIFGAG
ncbi:MAG: FAD-dependent oxidoreductase [Planctomycetaceae bacterium]|jgi:NADPH-dependent 2,4-dienoyl-CoA reductase/sulfur reductase-like enzyme/rhodanese-related sulfurtransferase|nr:FAD-dependent oxidoreductase [Planctomycetaceae bacterium]